MSVVLEIYNECCIGNLQFPIQRGIYPNFQYNTRGIYPKFHCYTHAIPS